MDLLPDTQNCGLRMRRYAGSVFLLYRVRDARAVMYAGVAN